MSCAIYNDIKSNNTSTDVIIGKVCVTTDSDITTLGLTSPDPGDLTCPGVLMVPEDEWDSDKAYPSIDSPCVHMEGPAGESCGSAIECEVESSFPSGNSSITERGTWPSVDHSEGDAHPVIKHFEYNSACLCI